MLEILALCSCACVVYLWCTSTLGSCDKKSKTHQKRHKGSRRSSSCPANRNSPCKKIPKSYHGVSCFFNTPFTCCKCNERCRKQLRRVKTCGTHACDTSNLCKSYPIVHSCSDSGARNAVFTRTTKSVATSYAPPSISLPAIRKTIGNTRAALPKQRSKQSQWNTYDVNNNQQYTNFWLNSPENLSYGIPQAPIQPILKPVEPINAVIPEFVPRPACSALRSPCANYYKSIESGTPSYKLICKTCQLEKHKCICAHFWCNPIFRAGYPSFYGSNLSLPSDSPEFPTSKGTHANCAPIVRYPWSTVRLPAISDSHETRLKSSKKSRKKLSSTHKRQKKSESERNTKENNNQ